jgi:LysM repeat protein
MRNFIICFFILSSNFVFSQQSKFIAIQRGDELFLEHKVQPKENWYSIGRIYYISPKEIAKFNGLSMDKGLGIGQALKIPLGQSNFTQDADPNNGGVPVYHVVEPKETLFKVATVFKATAANIRKWNTLKSDQVNSGSSLIVGYLKPSVLASVETAPAVVQIVPKEQPIAPAPVPASKTEPKSELKKSVENQVPKAENLAPAPVRTEKIIAGSGQFAPLYDQQSKEGKQQKLENPVYGVFKSTSGWQDEKYYVLLNNVVPGTVVKIVSKSNNRQLFAKVLGAVPSGKESEGMVMRMSNATLAALGMTESAVGSVELSWFN